MGKYMNKKINQHTVEELKIEITQLRDDLETQKELYNLNVNNHGSIIEYREEIFGEDGKSGLKSQIDNALNQANDIKEKMDEFSDFVNGDDETPSLADIQETIISVHQKALPLENEILKSQTSLATLSTKIHSFTTTYQDTLKAKLNEVETIKKDLQGYRDQVVGGSLFKTFKDKAFWSNITSLIYSGIGIVLLLCSGGVLFWLLLQTDRQVEDRFIATAISFILFTASFVCSNNSKTFRKLTEEYAHKATLLQSFVGYREQYKQTLDDNEYSQFFKEVIEAVKINPSERIDKLLNFKWPFEKTIDTVNGGAKYTYKIATDTVKEKKSIDGE